jgi:hypothetical protein
MNATRHGLLARQAVLPNEDGDAFTGLLTRLREELQPDGVLEEMCVENIAAAAWRLARARRIESEILASEMYGAEEALAAETAEALLLAWKFGEGASAEEAATLESRARQQMARHEEQLEATKLGVAFMRDAGGPEALTKLSRYEAAIERSLSRNLGELRRLQSTRSVSR